MPAKPDRATSRSLRSTYDRNAPLPEYRVNLGTAQELLEHRRNVVMSPHAIRRLPITKQVVDKVLYVDPRELLEAVDAKFRDAPIIASGKPAPSPPRPPSPAPRPRAIRTPRARPRVPP
jgi:hypothetical protein